MEKNRLLLIPLFIGLALMVYSWFLSFPLYNNSATDVLFNHLSYYYWISLSILLPSMFMIALTFKSPYIKWLMTVGIVLTIYSSAYFYGLAPTVDAIYYRSLSENFIRTQTLNPAQQFYFQWPAFFILTDVLSSVSGLSVLTLEFIMYTLVGFLLASTLFIYASKVHDKYGFLIVIGFFLSIFLFLNYQDCPFTIALALLFTIFMLEGKEKSNSEFIVIFVIFGAITLMHAFVPLYFVAYALMRSIISKNRQYFRIFLLALTVFLLTGITIAQFTFASNILLAITSRSEYSSIATTTFRAASIPIDSIIQTFARPVTIIIVLACVTGFIVILVKRKTSSADKSILFAGLVFLGLGLVSFSLGSRAIPIAFVPIALGSVCLFETKYRRYFIGLFLILLTFFAFVPLNNLIINDSLVVFQTNEEYTTANFMIEKYDWNVPTSIFSHTTTSYYLAGATNSNVSFTPDTSVGFQYSNVPNYNFIIYSVSLGKYLQASNESAGQVSQLIVNSSDVLYNSGLSFIAEKPG